MRASKPCWPVLPSRPTTAEYIQQFEQLFRDLAAKHHIAFVPMIYKDLVHVPGTIQPDGIHPTAKGSEIIARTLMPALTPC